MPFKGWCTMPTCISNDMKTHIPALPYEQGYSDKKSCQLLAIRKTLVYKTLCLSLPGTTHNTNVQRHSRPCHLTITDHTFILALLNQQHTVYLDEIQEQLLLCHHVTVSIPTLTWTLCCLHFTHKDVYGKALEHSDHYHVIYMNQLANLAPDPEMLMFDDESSKDERTSNRRRSWSCKGMYCVQRKCFVCERRFSILPILTLDGIIAHDIIEGSVTSERFVDFLQALLVCDNLASLYSCCWFSTRYHSPILCQSLHWCQ